MTPPLVPDPATIQYAVDESPVSERFVAEILLEAIRGVLDSRLPASTLPAAVAYGDEMLALIDADLGTVSA